MNKIVQKVKEIIDLSFLTIGIRDGVPHVSDYEMVKLMNSCENSF